MVRDLLTLYVPITTLKPVDDGIWIAAAYPHAIAWASRGARAGGEPEIFATFHADLGDVSPPQWATEIDQVILRGSRFLDEVVFLHRQSKTLILPSVQNTCTILL